MKTLSFYGRHHNLLILYTSVDSLLNQLDDLYFLAVHRDTNYDIIALTEKKTKNKCLEIDFVEVNFSGYNSFI